MKRQVLLAGGLVVFAVTLISFGYYGYQMVNTPNVLVDQEPRAFYVRTGESFDEVRDRLWDEGVLQDILSFSVLAKFKKYDELVKPGRYVLETNMTNMALVNKLRAGDQTPVRVTFNTIRMPDELAEKITANLEISAQDFLTQLKNPAMAQKYGFKQETLMAMFIPNTYEMWWNITVEDLFARMHEEYQAFWTDTRRSQAEALDLNLVEVSTLASIVQEEVSHWDEAPVVAGLYLNRLSQGIKLDADPTLKFAAGDFTITRVLNVHKEIDSPYNTYRNRGLPPGPISLPEQQALNAVLQPEDHSYLYMCAKEDFSGYHNFAKSLTEHNRNAARYQAALNQRRIFN
ncbi:MAG TPA: endolytic transglycosylase MltG [Cytophagales bacterium]|nr:endolytic transglycosylase MltG [Cytophagales bacterium]HAA21001.1 endolytic transglycosylase MltG [Cytophagales bacterium]HAP61533.1 endolytic transglycosylase MltG [Cytophagales bacterium]